MKGIKPRQKVVLIVKYRFGLKRDRPGLEDTELVHLTLDEIAHISPIIEAERDRLKQLMKDEPNNKVGNQLRAHEIKVLDNIVKKLMIQIS